MVTLLPTLAVVYPPGHTRRFPKDCALHFAAIRGASRQVILRLDLLHPGYWGLFTAYVVVTDNLCSELGATHVLKSYRPFLHLIRNTEKAE